MHKGALTLQLGCMQAPGVHDRTPPAGYHTTSDDADAGDCSPAESDDEPADDYLDTDYMHIPYAYAYMHYNHMVPIDEYMAELEAMGDAAVAAAAAEDEYCESDDDEPRSELQDPEVFLSFHVNVRRQ